MEVSFHFLLFLYHIWYKCVQLRKKYLQVFVLKIKQWNLGATWENTLGKMQRVKGNSSDGHLESQHFAGDCNLIVPAELAWDAAEISSLFSLFQPTQRILVRAVTTITPLKWRKGDLSASEHLSFVLHEKSSFVSLPAFPTTAAVPSSPWVWDDSSWHLWVTNAKDAEMSIKLHSHFPMTTTPQFTIKLETQRKQVIVGCSGFFLVFFFLISCFETSNSNEVCSLFLSPHFWGGWCELIFWNCCRSFCYSKFLTSNVAAMGWEGSQASRHLCSTRTQH